MKWSLTFGGKLKVETLVFDLIYNWTKCRALYYTEEEVVVEEKVEYKEFIQQSRWKEQAIKEKLSTEMAEDILNDITLGDTTQNDKAWWTAHSFGIFLLSSQHMSYSERRERTGSCTGWSRLRGCQPKYPSLCGES